MTTAVDSGFITASPVSKSAMRAMIDDVAEDLNALRVSAPWFGGTTTGTATAYSATVDFGTGTQPLADGLAVVVRIHLVNGADPTFSFNGTTARPITRLASTTINSIIPGGLLPVGFLAHLVYRAATTSWVLINQPMNLGTSTPFLTNGGFRQWSIGTSIAIPASSTTTATVYGPDQWCMETSAGQACTISRQAAAGTTLARYRCRVQRNAGQTGVATLRFQQPLTIDDVTRLRGEYAVIGFIGLAGGNFSGTLRVKLLMGTGTESRRTNAAAFTGEVELVDAAITLTGAGIAYAVPTSIVGLTAATQGALVFEWTPSGTAGAADFFQLGDVWLQPASISQEYVTEPADINEARCQQFLNIIPAGVRFDGYSAAGATVSTPIDYPRMRATPTVSGTASATTNIATGPTFSSITDRRLAVTATATALGTTAFAMNAITLDARL